ncbi:LptA/OstA family protein [Francisella sp. XLW-1]|uniref:LptA/OstA family protein n=1 Tax=Francisella sp. XLW-1 TaxID=2610887 RepID=UPI00123DC161|nr:LptA/OstA family protein [Francisella sp. XLW-1]
MHLVRIALVLILLVFTSNAFSETQVNQIDDTLPMYNAVVQEDNVADNEKEDNSEDNSLREYGPVTICADSVVYVHDQHIITYLGNVFAMQIHNNHILCHKPTTPKDGVVYFERNKDLSLEQLQESWLKTAKQLCSEQKECNFISGQRLIINLDDKNKLKTFTMISDDNHNSQFYTYPTNSNPDYKDVKTATRGPVEGKSKMIIYHVDDKHLEMYRKAVAFQNDNVYKGEKVIFDIEHDLISIPGSENKRSTIILDGVQKQTKIDTGLTPISDYEKDRQKGSVRGLNTYNSTT